MNNKIKILSEETINKIAAGEVVDRPASVVKELMENSLDAQATQLEVSINGAGKNLIRVTDNGTGMEKEEALLALQRYATSKISSISDLEKISTLGFRGEALPSICAVSRLTLITKSKDSPAAVKLVNSGGRLLEVKETGAPTGTMVEVRNIFFNLPARKKFLKSNQTELTNIINVFSNYVLTSRDCGFKLINDDKVLLEVFAKDSLLDRIRVLYDRELAGNILPLASGDAALKIDGYVSNPAYTKPSRSAQLVVVNNRPVVSRGINYAVYEAYSGLVPKGRFPAAFLFIAMPPGELDVNVHPGKREVRFRNERMVQDMIKGSIYQVFQGRRPGKTGAPHWRQEKQTGERADYISKGAAFLVREAVSAAEEAEFILPAGDAGLSVVGANYNLAQMNDAYIICETAKGFDIIDQHAVHERIIYERIKRNLDAGQPESQRLLIPISVELDLAEEQLINSYLALLNDLGFALEEFGKRTVKVEMIPAYLDKLDPAVFVKDMLTELKVLGKTVSPDVVREKIMKIMACRAAVKQGDRLDRQEMQRLIKEWYGLSCNFTCPHGRPAVISFSREELDKKFQRS